MKSLRRSLSRIVLLGALAIVPCACNRATVLNPSANDALRAENQSLRDQVDRLSLQVRELEASNAARRASQAAGSGTPAGTNRPDPAVEAATPRVASLQIEGATECVTEGSEPGSPMTLRLWVAPQDGRGRFLQIVGHMAVGISYLRAGEAPVAIATAAFDPAQVRDAWRSGLMGSHYAFAIPIAPPPELRSQPLTVSIRFVDALTGQSFEDERRIAAARSLGATLSGENPNQ